MCTGALGRRTWLAITQLGGTWFLVGRARSPNRARNASTISRTPILDVGVTLGSIKGANTITSGIVRKGCNTCRGRATTLTRQANATRRRKIGVRVGASDWSTYLA